MNNWVNGEKKKESVSVRLLRQTGRNILDREMSNAYSVIKTCKKL